MATALIVADTVLLSATVELRVPVATPLAFVVPTGWVSVLPVPVAASTTVAPEIGLPNWSFAVTVSVLWLVPLEAVIGGVARTVDCAADTPAGAPLNAALVAPAGAVPAPVRGEPVPALSIASALKAGAPPPAAPPPPP